MYIMKQSILRLIPQQKALIRHLIWMIPVTDDILIECRRQNAKTVEEDNCFPYVYVEGICHFNGFEVL